MKDKLLMVVVGIALVAAGFAAGYWYGQKIIRDLIVGDAAGINEEAPIDQAVYTDADVASLFIGLTATSGSIVFSEVTDSNFSWYKDDGSSVEISGKEISTNIVATPGDFDTLDSNRVKMEEYLASNGFTKDVNNDSIGTTVGSQGYVKGSMVCKISGGWNDTPLTSTSATDKLSCGILNQ